MYFNLAPWVIIFPLIGMVVNLLVGKRLGEIGIGAIASLAAGLSFGVAVLLAFSLAAHPEAVTVQVAEWIPIYTPLGNLALSWAVRVDTLSVTMMLVVAGVGTLIHIYAIGYMHQDVRHNGDPGRFRRFFVYMNLFILAMMVLVSADNYLMTFVGWEGVGLCSYLLIGFWFEKGQDGIGNAKAAKKAFIANRVGDFGFLIAMFLIFSAFGSLRFEDIFSRAAQVAQAQPGIILAITLFMLLAVTGKSAQLPLYVWLPDAMAGPTPVSALIHAATMVTAGVYLVARSNALYSLAPVAQNTVAWVGAATALFAATIAVAQYDIKKVLAYSTISQLGFMVAAVGMGAFAAGMFHLVTHAFFKGLLFLSAGSVIQGVEHGEKHTGAAHGSAEASFDPQDMRNMGGLRSRMKVTFWVYLAGALALAGIFPLAGFFSKDEILAEAMQLNQPGVLVFLVLAAFLTAFYMGRQVFMVFFGKARSDPAAHAQENPPLMTLPLVALAVLSVIGGALNLPGVHTLETWLEHTIGGLQPAEFILPLALLALAVALLGIFLAWSLYGRSPLKHGQVDPLSKTLGPVFRGMERKWWVDEFYGKLVIGPYHALAGLLAQPVDQGVIDAAGNGLGTLTQGLSAWLRRVQTGFVRSYALAVLAGGVVILAYIIFR
ncbi:MAG: NADH-quinone oxidoreductase subunit L [Chloroflexi bacterium]|nr:NADH-quinone oxidoreductase subunit L [Chloroflexota bacterium]